MHILIKPILKALKYLFLFYLFLYFIYAIIFSVIIIAVTSEINTTAFYVVSSFLLKIGVLTMGFYFLKKIKEKNFFMSVVICASIELLVTVCAIFKDLRPPIILAKIVNYDKSLRNQHSKELLSLTTTSSNELTEFQIECVKSFNFYSLFAILIIVVLYFLIKKGKQ